MSASTSAASCRSLCPERDALDVDERQLQEALAELAEERRIARREEAVRAEAIACVLPVLARQRFRHLARRLLGREDEGDVAAEDALEHGPDQRIVRAAEDDRVAAGLF